MALSWPDVLARLTRRESLTEAEAEATLGRVLSGEATRDVVQNIYLRKTEMKDGKLANIEFDTIPNVKDPWKEQNPPK